MRFEVIIPSTRVQGEEASVIVHARNWKAALRQGLTRQGEDPSLVRGAVCDIRSDDVVHITDAVSLRTFRLIVLDRDATPTREAAKPRQPLRDSPSTSDNARHTRLLHHVPTTELPAMDSPPEPATTILPAIAKASPQLQTPPPHAPTTSTHHEHTEQTTSPAETHAAAPTQTTSADSKSAPDTSAPRSTHLGATTPPEPATPHIEDMHASRPQPPKAEVTEHTPDHTPSTPAPPEQAIEPEAPPEMKATPKPEAAPQPEVMEAAPGDEQDATDMGFVDLMADPEEPPTEASDVAASIAEAVVTPPQERAATPPPRQMPSVAPPLAPQQAAKPSDEPNPMKTAEGLTREDLRRRGAPTTLMPQVSIPKNGPSSTNAQPKLKHSRRSPSSSIRYKSGAPRAHVSNAAKMRAVKPGDVKRVSQNVERHRRVSSATIRVVRPEDLKVVAENALEDIFLEIHDLFELKMSIEAATDFVLDMAVEKIPCESASVLFATPDGAELYFAGARGPKAASVMDERLKIHEGIAGFCTQNGVSLMIDDVKDEPRFHAAITDELGLKVTSLICAPIQIKGRIYGCIQLLNHKQGPVFKGAHLDALGYIGFQLARLIQERLIDD